MGNSVLFWDFSGLRFGLLGMYFLSAVLLMRMSVPLEYREIITQVLGGLEFHFYHSWSDVIFFVSSISTLGLFFLMRLQIREKTFK